MKVILLKDVAKVGRRNEIKDLADGYARNFIIARGLGLPADDKNISQLKREEGGRIAKLKSHYAELRQLMARSAKVPLLLKQKANAEGHLFAGIKVEDLVQTLKREWSLELDPRTIVMPEVIKKVGHYGVEIKIAPGEQGKLEIEVKGVPS